MSKKYRIGHRGTTLEIIPVNKRDDMSPKIRRFDEKMMAWYHQRGMHQGMSADELLKRFPTFLVRIGSFTLSLQSGGKKYPQGFSLTVFNPKETVVDDRNYLYPKRGEKVPKRWPHGAHVVDGSKPMKFISRNRRHPRFIP